MAFVSKSERNLTVKLGCTDSIGPGQYTGHDKYTAEPSFAPFSSNAPRKQEKEPENEVGPGTYEQSEIKKQETKNKKAVPFKTQDFRFKAPPKHKINPGPGQYNIRQKWGGQQRKGYPSEPDASWMLSVPSAPSIPSQKQWWGFAETLHGELVMKRNPEKVYAGTTLDSVGPGHYKPNSVKPKSSERAKGAGWWKSKSSRTLQRVSQTGNVIGPGSYTLHKTQISPMYKFKPSAAFASKTHRDVTTKKQVESEYVIEGEDQGLPGPGSYYSRSQSQFQKNPIPIPQHLQHFGSTDERFDKFKACKPNPYLSPATYTVSASKKAKVGNKGSLPAASNAEKDKDPAYQRGKSVPGPGTYVDQTFSHHLNKKMWGRDGIFGSKAQRFSGEELETPGPAHYAADAHKRVGAHNAALRKPNSVFTSTVPRIDNVQNENPSPGAYNVVKDLGQPKIYTGTGNPLMSAIGASQISEAAFHSKATRFGDPEESTTPGPSNYDVNEELVKKTSIGGFVPLAQRPLSMINEAPGPGTYFDEESAGEWNKKTFNIMFSEVN